MSLSQVYLTVLRFIEICSLSNVPQGCVQHTVIYVKLRAQHLESEDLESSRFKSYKVQARSKLFTISDRAEVSN